MREGELVDTSWPASSCRLKEFMMRARFSSGDASSMCVCVCVEFTRVHVILLPKMHKKNDDDNGDGLQA